MLTVESGLLIGLGFLIAGLLVLLFAPAYWARAVRITSAQIRATLPLNEAEIRAEHGRLRAQHALTIHDLERELEQMRQFSAHGRIEINRRDAEIAALVRRVDQLESDIEVSENARRVLEQTITDRVPDVERHLRDAQRALEQRDQEVARLRTESSKAFRALQEAIDIGDQRKAEIARLNLRLEAGGARARDTASESGKAETALKAELEALRAKTRAQDLTIQNLEARADITNGASGAGNGVPVGAAGTNDAAAPRARNGVAPPSSGSAQLIEALEATISSKEAEIEALKSALANTDDGEPQADAAGTGRSVSTRRGRGRRETRIEELDARLTSERERARSLQSELAAANEKLARQAANFMEEMRRLGGRGARTADRRRSEFEQSRKPSLRERIVDEAPANGAGHDVRPALASGSSERASPANDDLEPAAGNGKPQRRGLMARISNFDKAD